MMFLNNDSKPTFPICRFNKDYIYVQSTVEIINMNSFSDKITLNILNNYSNKLFINNKKLLQADEVNHIFCNGGKLDEETSAICLQIPIGGQEDAFVNDESYKNFEMMVPDGWSVSKWQKSGDKVSCSIISSRQQMVLDEYECVSVGIGNIVSLCAPGATYVNINIRNVANVTELYKTFHLLKIAAPLYIISFNSEKPVLAQGEYARLEWRTAEKINGKIIPNEFNISKGVSEYREPLMKSKTFTLEIENSNENCKESCTVYISPPIIQSLDLKVLKSSYEAAWSTEYSSGVAINGVAQNNTGVLEFPKNTGAITLSCKGYPYCLEKTTYPIYFDDLGLECIRYVFQYYTILRIKWKAGMASRCKLKISEPEDHEINDLSKGAYEYIYLHPSKAPLSNEQLMILFIDSKGRKVEIYKSANWK